MGKNKFFEKPFVEIHFFEEDIITTSLGLDEDKDESKGEWDKQ